MCLRHIHNTPTAENDFLRANLRTLSSQNQQKSAIFTNLNFDLQYIEWPFESVTQIAGRTISSIPACHDVQAHPTSIKIQNNQKTLVFSGDTGWNDALLELSANADGLICECSYLNYVFPGHLSLEEIEKNRDKFTANKLILTHLNDAARSGAAAASTRLNLYVADDGLVFDF